MPFCNQTFTMPSVSCSSLVLPDLARCSRGGEIAREQVVSVTTAGGSMAKERIAQKDATMYTKAANGLVRERLPFGNQSAYTETRRGMIEQVTDLVVPGPTPTSPPV